MTFLKTHLLFILLFITTTLIGLSFVFSLPLYQGPDEQIHYATIQYHTEPKEKTWATQERDNRSPKVIRDFHLSEEVIVAGEVTQFDQIKWQDENTAFFTPGQTGINEELLQNTKLKRYIDTYPINTSSNTSFYYSFSSALEKLLMHQNILERFFALRIFSLLLYLVTIYIVYRIAGHIFPTPLLRILFTATVALQPMLITTGAIVNIDIALILGTTLFFLGAVSLLLSPSWRSHLLIILGLILAFWGKASGIAFIPVAILLYLFFFQERFFLPLKKILLLLGSGILLAIPLGYALIPQSVLTTFLNLGTSSKFPSLFSSLTTYLDKTLRFDTFLRTYTSYWGNFGWLDTTIHEPVIWLIFLIELTGFIGALVYLISGNTKSHLPHKKILVLSWITLLFLQLAIRFYDWRVFDTVGQVVIGAPGRYFLPTLVPHILITVTGLGYLLTKNRFQFTLLLKALSLGMLILTLYSLFTIIIPRYYL